jgi:hypothetical protein
MAEDEAETLAALKACRTELIDPKVAEHHGRVVKLMGDGALVEFASVVNAVLCAVEIQDAMFLRNADVPEDRGIAFRIGINVGDVIVEEDDIYGDGVNVAARLEGLAEPGGICVSGVVRHEVRDKLPFAFEDLGEQSVKSIPRPIHVFRVKKQPMAAGAAAGKAPPGARRRWRRAGAITVVLALIAGAGVWIFAQHGPVPPTPGTTDEAAAPSLPAQPSLAVLPFDNLSGDPDQDYFSDGMTDDLITTCLRFPASSSSPATRYSPTRAGR